MQSKHQVAIVHPCRLIMTTHGGGVAKRLLPFLIESFNLDPKARTTFNFKFSRLFSKIDTPESFRVLFFTTKVNTLISVEGD